MPPSLLSKTTKKKKRSAPPSSEEMEEEKGDAGAADNEDLRYEDEEPSKLLDHPGEVATRDDDNDDEGDTDKENHLRSHRRQERHSKNVQDGGDVAEAATESEAAAAAAAAEETAAADEDDEAADDNDHDEEAPKTTTMELDDATTTTTALPARKSVNRPGKAAEAGIIKEVYMENFMCHRKLTLTLGRNANAITGDNGSGKSAVLAAIQIGLGANARRTHRARNLKGLVKRDATHAKIRVTLWNQGPDAYQPSVYGDTISVERGISLTGSGFNGFRLLDSKLKVQSEKKSDLEEMLDHL